MTAPTPVSDALDRADWYTALARVSDYWAQRTANNGETRCAVHRVEHTARTATSIVVDLALHRVTGRDGYWDQVLRRATRVVARLVRDPEHGAWIFSPGRLNPYNCSNNVIDSGESARCLGTLLIHADDRLNAELRDRIENALRRNATTYLTDAVATKEVTNQRLWGAMGLATAARALCEPTWFIAVRTGIERSLAEQNADGSFPYHPAPERFGIHPGAADISIYYQSRVLTYLWQALEMLGDDASEVREPTLAAIRRGLDFLAATYRPYGTKCAALEGKRWFWAGPYEVGSHPLDMFALLHGAARFNAPRLRALAEQAGSVWRQHLEQMVLSCREMACRDDFICPDFHAADASWLAALILTESPEHTPDGHNRQSPLATPTRSHVDKVANSVAEVRPVCLFTDAGLVRLQTNETIALLRTRKRPANVLHGGGVGGGSLLYVGHESRDWHEVIAPELEKPISPGNLTCWPQRPSRRAALRAFLAANRPGHELRQWLFVVRIRLRQRAPRAAARALWRGWLRPLWHAWDEVHATHWALDASPTLLPVGIQCTVRPARRDGEPLEGVTVRRQVSIEDGDVRVKEEISVEASLRRMLYAVPGEAQVLHTEPAELGDASSTEQDSAHRLDFPRRMLVAPFEALIEYVL
ncbi:MAG: hypothetical protein CL878_13140 [Dehalococcoidia bacterium]|nr:hypothetical protein [Dehalococcoidia bacterium]